jgi:pimeloyl-ACP methyl ester carboxylesterase
MANPFICMIKRPFKRNETTKKLVINTENGIYEKRFVEIGEIEQWITIRGQNKNNPAILFLHGGPDSTYTPFNSWLLDWEKYFTIIQWDQIGSGKTFKKMEKLKIFHLTNLHKTVLNLLKLFAII